MPFLHRDKAFVIWQRILMCILDKGLRKVLISEKKATSATQIRKNRSETRIKSNRQTLGRIVSGWKKKHLDISNNKKFLRYHTLRLNFSVWISVKAKVDVYFLEDKVGVWKWSKLKGVKISCKCIKISFLIFLIKTLFTLLSTQH